MPAMLAAAEPVDYLRQIKPVLSARCLACHGALKQEGGLRLDTAASILKGGESGPAITHGKSGESLIVERVSEKDPDLRMPPESEGSALKETEIALLKAWIDQGAAGPADEKPEADPREHWSFRAPTRPAVPHSKDAAWVRNPIDAFIAARHTQQGLTPQPPADKRLLLRRVYLDLIGLPPTLAELDAFAADDSADAYERVVDRLLASPQYGERWGRHWMDIWRYSDWWGLGAEVRNSQKHMWHWRDWMIESLNRDLGYDQMIQQMLAADELYPNDLDKLRATGFLARHYFRFNRNTWLEETVEHTSKAFLGLTLNCARCHDHKYDPVKQTDYYRFRAFFEPYQVRMDQLPGEADYEKDGIPRVFDCHLDAPTYRFVRGDEKQPVKDEPLTPGFPALLAFDDLTIEPVSLPLEAHQPGLRPWVSGTQLAAAKQKISASREALKTAQDALVKLEAATKPAKPAEAAALDTLLDKVTDPPAVNKPAADAKPPVEKPVTDKPPVVDAELDKARRAATLAEKSLAAAEALLPALEAKIAADRARFSNPVAASAAELAKQAAQAERKAAHAKAAEALAQAELDLVKAAEAKKAAEEKKVAAARDALAKAEKALESTDAKYTSLTGAIKTPESPTETADQRARPFPTTSTGRRTALARWLTDRRNPLTARVAVNHLWSRHFNKPLVVNVFEFGRKGSPPTHPELLDWLAIELMSPASGHPGWSMKHLHRLMVTSNTYRMASTSAGADENVKRDAENASYWRMNPGRVEAQVVRDAMLHLSSELDPALSGPSIPVASELSRRRSLYFVHSHNDHHRFLSMFDDASVQECYRRDQSIVPQQALALANSRQALDAAARIAARLESPYTSDAAFIRAAFVTVLASEPNPEELAACREALAAWTAGSKAGGEAAAREARVSLVHALLNHNDFVTVR